MCIWLFVLSQFGKVSTKLLLRPDWRQEDVQWYTNSCRCEHCVRRQPPLFGKWKTTSIFLVKGEQPYSLKIDDDLNFGTAQPQPVTSFRFPVDHFDYNEFSV